MDDQEKKFLEALAQMPAKLMDPNTSDSDKEQAFWEMFGLEKHDDIKIGDVYTCHTGFAKLMGRPYDNKVTGLMDGRVMLLGIDSGVSSSHKIDEFRELVEKGDYVKV